MSATLKAGQSGGSRKSITEPDRTRSARLPIAPPLTSPTATQAVEQLQIDAGLPVTGQVDEATRQVLETGFIPQEGGLPVVRFRDTLPLAAGSP